ncbi:MAG TPA: hypothetical protein VHM64_17905, partial [Candidatus Binatia bacterium]|nr:hypothetical protein [Candidatus Binatia bacterium]
MKLSFLFTLILNSLIFGGCFAHKFSSPLLPFKEDDEANAAFRDMVVAVAAPVSESYELTKLIDALQKTQLFKEAGAIDQLSRPPDLILDSWVYEGERDSFSNCSLGFEGEMLTIGTAGLIPQICERRHSVSFDLYSSKNKKTVQIAFAYETGGAVGWAALFYNASPEWSAKAPAPRYQDLLKA